MMNEPERPNAEEPGNGGARASRPDLGADLHALGENLREALRAVWGSAERERLQAEIEGGLASLRRTLGQTFDEAARDLRDWERGRERVSELRAKVAGVGDEIRSAHVGDKVRSELHEVLQGLNEQLRRSRERWTPRGASTEGTAGGTGEAGGARGATGAAGGASETRPQGPVRDPGPPGAA